MTVTSSEISSLLQEIGAPRLLVLGDCILDCYTWGNAERISPEAPVIVLTADRREMRLGGAAGVAYFLKGLEANSLMAGVVGDDEMGAQVLSLMEQASIDASLILSSPEHVTTTKERFIGRAAARHPQQILRVDREVKTPLDSAAEERLFTAIAAEIPNCQAVLISDYNKGVCTPQLIKNVVKVSKEHDVPVVVDPARISDYSSYCNATLLTPNRYEIQLATGKTLEKPEDAFAIGRDLCDQLGLDALVVTLDRDGMALVHPDGSGQIFPTVVRDVYDITGAGDMVLAMLGLCAAARIPLDKSVQLANVAAGLEVECIGIEQISRSEICGYGSGDTRGGLGNIESVEAMASLAEMLRRHRERIVFTNGCFDVLHYGHVYYLQEAAKLGDVLVVGLNSDASVRKIKGADRPVNVQQQRAGMLTALSCVDHVVIFDDETPHDLLRQIRPDVLVKGGTYDLDEVVGKEVVEAYGGQVCVTGKIDDCSSSGILRA